jgi:hypothetical protein
MRRFNDKAGLSEIALLTFGVLPNSKKRRLAEQTVASLSNFKALIRRLTIGGHARQ